MGLEKTLVKEITHYLDQLNIDQQKAVLGVVKTFAQEEVRWDESSYIEEMDRRFAEMESSKVSPITLDELEAGARMSYQKRKR